MLKMCSFLVVELVEESEMYFDGKTLGFLLLLLVWELNQCEGGQPTYQQGTLTLDTSPEEESSKNQILTVSLMTLGILIPGSIILCLLEILTFNKRIKAFKSVPHSSAMSRADYFIDANSDTLLRDAGTSKIGTLMQPILAGMAIDHKISTFALLAKKAIELKRETENRLISLHNCLSVTPDHVIKKPASVSKTLTPPKNSTANKDVAMGAWVSENSQLLKDQKNQPMSIISSTPTPPLPKKRKISGWSGGVMDSFGSKLGSGSDDRQWRGRKKSSSLGTVPEGVGKINFPMPVGASYKRLGSLSKSGAVLNKFPFAPFQRDPSLQKFNRLHEVTESTFKKKGGKRYSYMD